MQRAPDGLRLNFERLDVDADGAGPERDRAKIRAARNGETKRRVGGEETRRALGVAPDLDVGRREPKPRRDETPRCGAPTQKSLARFALWRLGKIADVKREIRRVEKEREDLRIRRGDAEIHGPAVQPWLSHGRWR
jgi:hypothetical protein